MSEGIAGRLLGLAAVFVPLSLATVGGGQAVVSEIQRQVVDVHHWMTLPAFLDAFAISRMAPGPGTPLVTLVGWHVAGPAGALVATLAIFGPTSLLIYALARAWARYRGARWQGALERGLRPVAAGMILAAVYVLLRSIEGGWLARGIAVASAGTLLVTRVNPLLLLGAGAALFVALRGLAG